ncbi:MAG: GGDEF domain-containing protein [Thermoanaerobaculia bacterium]
MGGLLLALERLPKRTVFGVSVLLIVLIGLLDWVTGEDISVSIFYMVPILLATWRGGTAPGLLMNALCAPVRLLLVILWQGSDLLRKPELYWNLVVEGSIFITLTLITSALRRHVEEQRLLARTDSLTGVANRRAFYERAELELSRARRFHEPLSVAYVDVDDFKRINDDLGHDAGDELLTNVAGIFQRRVRTTDLVARLGGDEFALLLPSTGSEASLTLLSELFQTLGAEMERQAWPITFSIGAVTFLRPPASVDDVLRHVDELMYRVKEEGKAGVKHAIFPLMSGST